MPAEASSVPRLTRIVPRELGLGRGTRRRERRWLVRQIEGGEQGACERGVGNDGDDGFNAREN